MHSNNQLGGVWELFCAGLESASSDHHIVSVECSQVVRIRVRREDQRTFNDHCAQDRGGIDIHQQVQALGDAHEVSFDWRELSSPGEWLGPVVHVSKDQSLSGHVSEPSHVYLQSRSRIKTWSLACDALNMGAVCKFDCADSVIDEDGVV